MFGAGFLASVDAAALLGAVRSIAATARIVPAVRVLMDRWRLGMVIGGSIEVSVVACAASNTRWLTRHTWVKRWTGAIPHRLIRRSRLQKSDAVRSAQ